MGDSWQDGTDVLVIGGGPAACWAALSARESGAEVVLVDKGYCGASGATAPAGNGVWYVEPDSAARAAAKASRTELGGHLADHGWMDRVLEQTYTNMNRLAREGRYPFPVDQEAGLHFGTGVQGPEYMRRMRAWLRRRGARIIDHAPALELLVDDAGAVRGAAGHLVRDGRDYRVTAGAVALATGGCAFLSRALGTNVDTGDGALMAAEVGARFSGMEFSNAYGIAAKGSTLIKTAYYRYATFFHQYGRVLEGADSARGRSVIARALLHEPVFAQLDRADAEVRAQMRVGQPNFFLQFDSRGIDPFTQRFEVDLLAEGTVRGTGGIDVVDDECATTVAGLYAACDAATRERICGGFTGGGTHTARLGDVLGHLGGPGRRGTCLAPASGFGRGPARRRSNGVAAQRLAPCERSRDSGRGVGRVASVGQELPARRTGSAARGGPAGPGLARSRRGIERVNRDRASPGAVDVSIGVGAHRIPRHEQTGRLPRSGPSPTSPHRQRRARCGLNRYRGRRGGGGMIELLHVDACIACDVCVRICPTDVFDRGVDGIPVIARQSDCQTCFMCEAYCPTDALFVDPQSTLLPSERVVPEEHIGRYRRELGWGRGSGPAVRSWSGRSCRPARRPG